MATGDPVLDELMRNGAAGSEGVSKGHLQVPSSNSSTVSLDVRNEEIGMFSSTVKMCIPLNSEWRCYCDTDDKGIPLEQILLES